MPQVDSSHPLIAVLGPTGSGKSALAIDLAMILGGEIVNCDSVQVHRGLDIGSAKTPLAGRRGIVHHLLDVVDPAGELEAGAYARLAAAALEDIRSRKKIPIIAGGTGFYLRSLLEGLSPLPERNAALRTRLSAVRERRPAALHRLLKRRDPAAAARIHPNDHQKLIRALEISGDALSGETVRPPRNALEGFRVLKIGLNPPRTALHARLNARSADLFSHGLLAETENLLRSGVSSAAKALQSVGYKQAVAVLTQGLPLEQAIVECQTRTRQYAKRQMTWLRREQNLQWLPGFGSDPEIVAAAIELVRTVPRLSFGVTIWQ